jgi:hypothetical protein
MNHLNFYQIRDKVTGFYYKRGSAMDSIWTDQDQASVWTTLAGPTACLGTIAQRNRRLVHASETFRGKNWKPAEPEIITVPVIRPKVTFVDGDDWEGLYIDDKLVIEGHVVRIDDMLRLLGIDGEKIYADDEWLQEQGTLPVNLSEVKRG